MSTVVGFDPLRDSRHRSARAARDVADWLAWLELGGLRPRTLADYEWAVARGLRMFPNLPLADWTDGELVHVLKTFPVRSRRVRRAAFESLFTWAKQTRRIAENPVDFLPAQRRTPAQTIEVFTETEVEALVSLPLIDGALMLILFDAGLRKGEARGLQYRHVRPEPMPGQIVVLGGKGGKDRRVPLTERLAQKLAELAFVEGLNPTDHLWYDKPGGARIRRSQPIAESAFHRWWTRCLDTAGVSYRNPHTARHTCATRMRRAGLTVDELQLLLGHASIRTTSDLYVHTDVDDLARALAAISERTETA